jgi:hypothetical protein
MGVRNRWGPLAVLALALCVSQGRSEEMTWQVGIGRRSITPETPVWLAGYGTKRVPDGKTHDLWVKVLALQDPSGRRAVLATTDHMGMSKTIYESLYAKIHRRFSLDRSEFMLTFSHNHCGPVLKDDLVDYSLRFKREFGPTAWVCGYANDMAAYIPSRRVWKEGGYEGGPHLDEYGRPACR